MHIAPTIHYNAGHNYIITYMYIIVQELMNLLHGKYVFSIGGFLR